MSLILNFICERLVPERIIKRPVFTGRQVICYIIFNILNLFIIFFIIFYISRLLVCIKNFKMSITSLYTYILYIYFYCMRLTNYAFTKFSMPSSGRMVVIFYNVHIFPSRFYERTHLAIILRFYSRAIIADYAFRYYERYFMTGQV